MLKKLKSLFVIEENNPTQESKTTTHAPKKKEVKSKVTSPENISPARVNEGKVDQKFVNVLLKAIDNQNMDGFDYLEYKQSLQSLSKMDMDEVTRYKSAFAMAKTMGATQPKLAESAEKYIKILMNEEQKFEDALKNQREKQVSQRQSQIKQLEQTIVTKENKIKSLQKEIEASKNKLEKEKSMINQAAAKVEATKDRFESAYQLVLGQIKNDLKKIKEYL
jgi:hypothetical protein